MVAGVDDVSGPVESLDRLVQLFSFLFHYLSLESKDLCQIEIPPVQKFLNLIQRKSDEFQRYDLLQTRKIPLAIQTITRGSTTAGFQQTQTIVMMQRADSYSGSFCEFTCLIY